MIMVKAGKPVDDLIDQLIPLLERATSSSTAKRTLHEHRTPDAIH